MGMSWFLQVSLHVLSSQQIIKGKRSYLELDREDRVHHSWKDGIRAMRVQNILSSSEFFKGDYILCVS